MRIRKILVATTITAAILFAGVPALANASGYDRCSLPVVISERDKAKREVAKAQKAIQKAQQVLATAKKSNSGKKTQRTGNLIDFLTSIGQTNAAKYVIDENPYKSTVHLGDKRDATNLINVEKGLSLLRDVNKYRAKDDVIGPQQPVRTSYQAIAVAAATADEANAFLNHRNWSQSLGYLENLAWGPIDDSIKMWYGEKHEYATNGHRWTYKTGHYANMMDPDNTIAAIGVSENNNEYGNSISGEFTNNAADAVDIDTVERQINAFLTGKSSSNNSTSSENEAIKKAQNALKNAKAQFTAWQKELVFWEAAVHHAESCPINQGKKPTKSTVAGYTDVHIHDWYAGPVEYVTNNKLMTGYNNGHFGPNDPVTREQAALILYRIAGQPEDGTNVSEYPDGHSIHGWAVKAVAWASATGVMNGYGPAGSGANFGPNDSLTREQAAKLIAVASKKYSKPSEADQKHIKNMRGANNINPSLLGYMTWAVNHGIIHGWPDKRGLQPTGQVDRAQMAKMIENAIKQNILA